MSLLDNLSGLLGQGGQDNQQLVKAVMGLVNKEGGLSNLIGKFQQGGLSDLVQSWLGQGENKPITGEQVKQVLDDSELESVAQELGTDKESAAGSLAGLLPQIIDKLSPDGQAPADNDAADVLKGMLGKLLG